MKDRWKRFVLGYVFVFVLGLVLVVVSVWYIDPFYNYHMPFDDGNVVLEKANYQNPGLARNAEYDSIITGSSVTENFRVSWFNEMFEVSAIKLPVGSGRTKNYEAIFEQVFNEERKVDKVFYGLDTFVLTCDSEEVIQEMPEYLYNQTILDDAPYLLNKDVILNEIPNTLSKIKSFNVDEAYTWDDDFEFGEDITIDHYKKYRLRLELPYTTETTEDYLKKCRDNLDNIVPYIEDNPDTEFYIFIPPYSILYWHDKERQGVTEGWLLAQEYAVEQLLTYDNVRLFFFQDIEEIICDLDNYKDYVHYTAEINYYMAECMRDGEYELTSENYQYRMEELRRLIEEYDFEAVLN